MDDERLLSTMEAAHYLGLDTGTLKRWRTRGAGPSYMKVSANRARYSLESLRAFLAARKRQHTADPGPGPAA
ncbi:MAG TPA: helix-turn-helix domain-containing protein [Polyangiaceae bacterium]